MTKIRLHFGQINWAGLGTSLLAGAFGALTSSVAAGHMDAKSIGVAVLSAAATAAWGFFTQRTDVSGGASPFPGLTSTDNPAGTVNRILSNVPAPILAVGTDALSIAANAIAAEIKRRDDASAAGDAKRKADAKSALQAEFTAKIAAIDGTGTVAPGQG